jgi:hypothetical protein
MIALLLLADIPATPRHSGSGTSVWLIVAIVAAVVVIGLGLLMVLRARRRR